MGNLKKIRFLSFLFHRTGKYFSGQFFRWFRVIFGTIILTRLPDYSGDFYEMRYRFTNFYLSFSIAKESARVNGALSSVFLGVCRTKRLSNAQTTHFFTRSWEPSKNSYLTILIYMTQKKEEKKVGKRQVYIVAKVHLMKSWGGLFLWKRIWDLGNVATALKNCLISLFKLSQNRL